MHVDIVKNEWLAGFQLVVARLHLEDDGSIRMESSDDERWRERILTSYEIHGERYDPADGERFLEHLAEHLHGDYLFASELHDQSLCSIPNMTRPIERVDGSGVPVGA